MSDRDQIEKLCLDIKDESSSSETRFVFMALMAGMTKPEMFVDVSTGNLRPKSSFCGTITNIISRDLSRVRGRKRQMQFMQNVEMAEGFIDLMSGDNQAAMDDAEDVMMLEYFKNIQPDFVLKMNNFADAPQTAAPGARA